MDKIRITFITVIFIFAILISGAVYAESVPNWVLTEKTKEGEIFVDTNSITPADKNKVWIYFVSKVNFYKPTKDNIKLVEFYSCAGIGTQPFIIRHYSITAYDSKNNIVSVKKSKDPPLNDVLKGTMYYETMQFLLRKAYNIPN